MKFLTKFFCTAFLLLAGGVSANAQEDEIVDFDGSFYHSWSEVSATATDNGEAGGGVKIGEAVGAGGAIWGNLTGAVPYLCYANITEYSELRFEGTPGATIRLMCNRTVDEGDIYEIQPKIGEDGKLTVSISDLKFLYGGTACDFVCLQAIKVPWGGAEVTLTSIKIVKPGDPLSVPKTELKNAINAAKMQSSFAKTEASWTALTEAIAAGEAALVAEDATAESLAAAKTAIEAAVEGLTLLPGYSELTADMFKKYASVDEPGEPQTAYPAYELFKASGLPYGDGSVGELNWADLTPYSKFVVTTVGEVKPRFCLNRLVKDGQQAATQEESKMLDINDNAGNTWSADKYQTIEDNTYTLDITKIVEDYTFARLHCIKKQGWGDGVIVTGMYLYKEPITISNMAIVGDFLGLEATEEDTNPNWNPANGWAMKQDAENPAIWTLTKRFTAEAKTYYYKATANGNWTDYVLPAGDNANYNFDTVDLGAGKYILTFTVNTEDHTIYLDAQKVVPVVFPENAIVFDFEAAAAAEENPANKNGSAANGQAFYGWEKADKTDSKRQDYKGYEWAEGSVLPEVCQVWRRSDRINGNVKDYGLYCPNDREMAVDGLEPGSKVIVVYDALEATNKELVWAIGDGTSEGGPGTVRATATINGVEAVTGETTIASGAEILVNTVTPAENGTGYIVFQVKKGMYIQQIAVIPVPVVEPDVYTVAGTKNLTGTEEDWQIVETNNMTVNAETGLYTWSAENITVTAEAMPEFKVVKNGTEWFPASDESGDHNWVITPDYLDGEGIYTITITFNAETAEIDVTGVKTGEVEPTGYTAYFINSKNWEKVCVWVWNGGNNLYDAWPGVEISKTGEKSAEGYDIYVWHYEGDFIPANIIFNNGINGEQTADLEFVNDAYYDAEGNITTGINTVATAAQQAVVYNMAGQRVMRSAEGRLQGKNAQKGLFIVDGKKVIR